MRRSNYHNPQSRSNNRQRPRQDHDRHQNEYHEPFPPHQQHRGSNPGGHYQHQDQQQHHHQQYSDHSHPPTLPPGWVEATDPSSGRTYFANPTTQETQWDRPVASTHPTIRPPRPSHSLHEPQSDWDVNEPPYGGIQTDRATGRSMGGGNYLYTAGGSASSNEAILQPEKIVKVTREMLEKVQAFPEQTVASDLELHSLTPGQVADLCKLQQRVHNQLQQEDRDRKQQQLQQEQQKNYQEPGDNANQMDEDFAALPPYTPINPFTMPLSGSVLMERTEPGRLDVRMNTLRRELKAFGYQSVAKNK
ncbi:WW domain containing protein [Nitzschia inconspicua]|uniref:WW domain containing protein n=1 Tax=Nitzschia inconspicua TaxID=303405 RepID=A0A9K3PYS9_9STRA|nr:WW domain containing protein [Nitzschia inconspicua]